MCENDTFGIYFDTKKDSGHVLHHPTKRFLYCLLIVMYHSVVSTWNEHFLVWVKKIPSWGARAMVPKVYPFNEIIVETLPVGHWLYWGTNFIAWNLVKTKDVGARTRSFPFTNWSDEVELKCSWRRSGGYIAFRFSYWQCKLDGQESHNTLGYVPFVYVGMSGSCSGRACVVGFHNGWFMFIFFRFVVDLNSELVVHIGFLNRMLWVIG